MTQIPRVSIGLPVYNGENLLAVALDSLLEQDFEDFELILSDNGSTDGTPEICREYAKKDERVKLLMGVRNVGAARNYNRTFDLAGGEYFKWAAHDDRYAPTFLSRCVEALDADDGVVLAYAQATDYDAAGNNLGDVDFEIDAFGPDPVHRFAEVAIKPHPCFQVFGVMRADVLAETCMHGSYTGADRVLLAELALRGRYAEIPERLFLHGEHPDRSVNAFYFEHQRYSWFDPRLGSSIAFPNWRMFGEYNRAIHRVPLDESDKLRAYAAMAPWANRFKVELARDVARPIRRKLTRR